MRLYCGLDVSNKTTAGCIIDESGTVVFESSCTTSEPGLRKMLKKFSKLRCVLESGPLSESLCEIIEKLGHSIDIVDARQAKAVTASKRKTDKLDARKLAQLARTGWYTRVHRKSGSARNLRSYLTARHQLVKIESSLVSAIRGILRAHGIVVPLGSGAKFETNVRQIIKDAQEPLLEESIEPLLRTWRETNQRQREMYKKLNRIARKKEDIANLMTVPGIGAATAAAFVATIDNPKRFTTSAQVASYIGLVPAVYQSGDTDHRGRITKHGDELLRWLLVEAATVLLTRSKGNDPLKEWGLKLKEKKGFGKARVAVARKLACLLHHLWLTEQSYKSAEIAAA